MASTIIIKNGSGSNVPSTLSQGELAINVEKGTLYYGTKGGTKVSSSFTFSEITSSGAISSSGDFVARHITASGNISASGEVHALNMKINNQRLTINDDNLTLPDTGLTVTGPITASGNISSSGDLYVTGDIGIGTKSPSEELEIFKTGENAQMAITRGTDTQLKLKAQDNQTRITYEGGPLLFDRDESGTNSLTLGVGGHVTASGNISSSGNIHATDYFDNGTNIATKYVQFANLGETLAETDFTAPAATVATNVTAVDGTSDSSAFFVAVLDGATGTQAVETTSKIKATPNTGVIAAGDTTVGAGVSTTSITATSHITASGNIRVSGSTTTAVNIDNSGHITASGNLKLDEFVKLNVNNKFIQGKETGGTTRNILGINGSDVVQVANANIKTDIKGTNISLSAPVTASIISSSSEITADRVYDNTYYQWEASARIDSDDDTNWQGPNSKGILGAQDWAQDYGTDYDDNTSTNAESRLLMNTGWWLPPNSNFSASLKSMAIYVQPNTNGPTGHSGGAYAADTGFSCSLWYSKNSDVVGEYGIFGSNAGTFVQRFAATVNSGQFKDHTSDKLFKYNNYLVTQSMDIDLAPGAWIFPRFKNFGTSQDFQANIYWVVHYCKKPI